MGFSDEFEQEFWLIYMHIVNLKDFIGGPSEENFFLGPRDFFSLPRIAKFRQEFIKMATLLPYHDLKTVNNLFLLMQNISKTIFSRPNDLQH